MILSKFDHVGVRRLAQGCLKVDFGHWESNPLTSAVSQTPYSNYTSMPSPTPPTPYSYCYAYFCHRTVSNN